ncbi:rho GTPase-activating protein gacF-like isoform X3 [Belonocnema kinseyi]|uniref:rho GTPase-activating protein gacF-like isoform X3 n=1 Tax=Belonocnema kinseyi TaxID=2817044 RepID=UPI00143CC1A5|nr:rho GTPase-activating protein gacF-like isoform X3 [Belonocnema kinseyi]
MCESACGVDIRKKTAFKMFVYDILHKEKVYQIVVSDLRSFGVKYRHKKNAVKTEKPDRNARLPQKQVFKMPLSRLSLDLVNLSSGAIVHVPVFLGQVSSYLLKHIDLEGIFRKAGSKTRQREIATRMDNGGTLEDKDHGIDVANCLKTFFRDLPEPLIPYAYHDLFVRCVMLKKNRVEALLLACLLLPPIHLNTLAFFMEFLKKVASYEELNKMGAANLATVVAPNIMPLRETTMVAVQSRLETHLVVAQLLIENAEKIGILPDHVAESISAEIVGSADNELDRSDSILTKSKKKKHRSGSLTRVLSGLKKMVGKNNSPLDIEPISDSSNSVFLYTPSLRIGKKRKVMEPPIDESNLKKKKDLLEAMPERTSLRSRYSFLSPVNKNPNPVKDRSPVQMSRVQKYLANKVHTEMKPIDKTEKSKKGRLSFDRFVSRSRQKMVEAESVTCREQQNPIRGRSWSVASRMSESKKKRTTISDESLHRSIREKKAVKLNSRKEYDEVFMDANVNLSVDGSELDSHEANCKRSKRTVPVHSKKRNSDPHSPDKSNREYISDNEASYQDSSLRQVEGSQGEEYVKIPKSEYEEIKRRVSTIETRISQEFKSIANESREALTTHSANKVQGEYEKTLEEAGIGSTMNADHLAKKLGKELKIRRSSEQKIIRSPSARKIGVMRRRSQEKPVSKRVSRTASWHISDRRDSHSLRRTTLKLNNFYSNTNLNNRANSVGYSKSEESSGNSLRPDTFCSAETNARLNYLQEQLTTLITHTAEHTKGSLSDEDFSSIDDDVFQPERNKMKLNVRRASSFHGGEFIDNSRYFNERVKELKKSNSQQNVIFNNETFVAESAPLERKETVITWKDAEKYFKSEGHTATPAPITGRASVAKLRTQNAGMVLAKAKLFDEAKRTVSHSEVLRERRIIQNQDVNRRQTARLSGIKSLDLDTTDTPRRQVYRKKKSTSPKNQNAKVFLKNTSNASPIIKMELVIVPAQETPQHRKYNDFKQTPSYQKENKGMKTPPIRKESKIYQESNINLYNSDVTYKTPLIKKPLSVKTPRSAKSLARRPAVEIRRTPLKSIGPLATPRRQSPRSILKTSHLTSRCFS